jgi:hypothetical protein
VEHTTTGVLPRTGAAVTIEGVTVQTKVDIGYKGSLAAGANTRVSFVNAAQNSVATNGDGVAINQPCIVEANAEATAGATASGALPLHSSGTKKIIVDVDTTGLNSGTIGAANAFTPYIFAVCYSEDGTAWYDSGIRVTVGKMTSIEHGIVAAPSFSKRPMYPTLKMMDGTDQRLPLAWTDGGAGNLFGLGLSHGISSARNVLPQTKQTVIHYKTDVGAALGTGRFMSLVNAELNGYKPCYRESAAALADNHHSGAILSTGGALHTITIPQDTLLDHTKVFAVCYAITDGTTADTSWADSYVRVTISKVDSITSIGVTHKVNKYDDQIASRALQIDKTTDYGTLDIVTGLDTPHNNKLDIDYAGTLGTSAKFALVDDWQNGGFPCATYTKAGGVNLASTTYAGDNKDGITNFDGPTKTASGYTTGEIAGYSDQKTFLAITKSLKNKKGTRVLAFATCYSEDGTNWYDTGIRVRRSPVYSMFASANYKTGAAGANVAGDGVGRHQTSVFLATNRIANSAGLTLTYVDSNSDVDEIGNDKFFSLVDVAVNGGNPCVGTEAGGPEGGTGLNGGNSATGTPSGQKSGWKVASSDGAGAGAGKKVIFDASFLNPATKFAVCYALTNPGAGGVTVWRDSYIRLKTTRVKETSIFLGQWLGSTYSPGTCLTGQSGCGQVKTITGRPSAANDVRSIVGSKIKHSTEGRLPQMEAGDHGLSIYVDGSIGPKAYVSFVDSRSGTSTTHGITYHNPCESAAVASAAPSATSTGPLATTGKGFCINVDAGGNTNVAANLCDADGGNAFNDQCVNGARCDPATGTNGGCGDKGAVSELR